MTSNLTRSPQPPAGWARALALGAALLLAAQASAGITHRYSFANDATDSVGQAHGTAQGNVFVSGGVATFPGDSRDSYIDLPSGLISNYTTVTFELWVDVGVNGSWGELYGFGNQTSDGAGANMVMFCPHTGSNPADFRMSYAQTAPGYNDEYVVNGSGILDNLGPMSVTCVYDPPNNSMSLYTNGVLVRTLSPVTTGSKAFSLANVYNVRSWLGRSLYNADSPYTGTIDEFRIFNEALGPLRIFVDNAAGPDTLVDNIVVNSLSWKVQTNMVVGSRQDTAVTFNTAKYGSVTLSGATEAAYTSSDPAIVKANAHGQLFALALGSATVHAAYNGTTNSVLVTVTNPELLHRYSFTSDASDSVGNANGKLMGSAKVSANAVVLPGDVVSSDPSVSYVDLPNNLLSDLTAVTIETWATDNGSANWARIWDLGNSVGGEDVSDTGSRFMFLCLPSDASTLRANIHINDRGGDNTLDWANGGRPAVGKKAHIVYTSDVARQYGALYVDGALVAENKSMTVAPADIGPSVNNWLGRSQYADPSFNGSIDEFRVYSGALSPFQIALDAASGPDSIVTDPGPVQALRLSLSSSTVHYGGPSALVSLEADFQSLTKVNVAAATGVTFTSSDTSIATLSEKGVLTATGQGQVTLTGAYGGKSATLNLTITTPPGYVKATLVHRYSFSEAPGSATVKDSVGKADGTVMGKGAAFDGQGQLSLPGGGISSDDPAVIAGYVDLPNHLFNVLPNLSIETWVTWQGSGSWQRIWDLGTSAGGEDVSSGNGGYLFLSPMGSANLRFSVRDPETGSEPAPVTAPTPLAPNQEVYIAVTYDHADNIARLYSNSVLVAASTAPVYVTTIDDVNNWLGRSQWGDPMFQGKFNEFRVWSGVLLPDQVASNFAAGPDSLEAPAKAPALTAVRSGGSLVISWPAQTAAFGVEASAQLGAGASWAAVNAAQSTANGVTSVTLPIGSGTQFFRLRR